jgi:hypothetical protein
MTTGTWQDHFAGLRESTTGKIATGLVFALGLWDLLGSQLMPASLRQNWPAI